MNIAITNQRDVLSHLVTFLSEPEKRNYQERFYQITNAEEHLRRAVVESYQKSVTRVLHEKVEPLIKEYKKTVLIRRDSSLSGALTLDEINTKLSRIGRLLSEGREVKARNRWDREWEDGVQKLVSAFAESKEFVTSLEKYIFQAKQTRLSYWGIIIGISIAVFFFLLGKWF